MIERTKPRRALNADTKTVPASSTKDEPPQDAVPTVAGDAVNLEAPATLGRREWFRALRPMLGSGLVELLRASNNLQRDLHDLKKNRD